MPRAKPDIEAKLCASALQLAAKQGWDRLTLDRIAAAAKVSPAQAKARFNDKTALLPAIVRYIDSETARGLGRIDSRAIPHDRLFEIMMRRFDALQEHRNGILAILDAVRRNPKLALFIIPTQKQSMRKMLLLAHLDPGGVRTLVAAAGLLAVYYRALWCWQADQTADMAKTMATLDKGLRCAGRAAEILFKVV